MSSNLHQTTLTRAATSRLSNSASTSQSTVDQPAAPPTPPRPLTPTKMTSNGTSEDCRSFRELSQALLDELEMFPEDPLKEKDINEILAPVAVESDIEAYLESTEYFSYGEWSFIPPKEGGLDEKDLYKPIENLCNDILSHFKLYSENSRRVFNTSKLGLPHSIPQSTNPDKGDSNAKFRSSPDLVAMLRDGNYFPEPVSEEKFEGDEYTPEEIKKRANYTTCASPIEVKCDKNHDGEKHWKKQCGMYARECFIQQPGRLFVLVPMITETRVRLYRFDCGGVLVGPWIDYYTRPSVLVRTILLACGQTGDLLGANPAIKWRGSKRFITITPKVTVTPREVEYEIIEPLFWSKAIWGRGTCTWAVKDKNGNASVVKLLWRANGRTPEWELLEKLKGKRGVVQIKARSEDWSLFDSRQFEPANPFAHNNRFACFIVMERYGASITEFTSPLQFLQCFRDAIQGHRNMWDEGILHRDISINNILHGQQNAEDGDRGILIDADLAIFFDQTESLCAVDCRTGTHAFQSCHVLMSGEGLGFVPAHEYLDDLESFFWVFCWIIVGYEVLDNGHSKVLTDLPKLNLHQRFQQHPQMAYDSKFTYLHHPSRIKIHKSWPLQFECLRDKMAAFFRHYTTVKETPPKEPVTRKSLAVPVEYHYKTILGYIDDTMKALADNQPLEMEDAPFDFGEYDKRILLAQESRAASKSSSVSIRTSSISASSEQSESGGSSPLSSAPSSDLDPDNTDEEHSAAAATSPPESSERHASPFSTGSPLSDLGSDSTSADNHALPQLNVNHLPSSRSGSGGSSSLSYVTSSDLDPDDSVEEHSAVAATSPPESSERHASPFSTGSPLSDLGSDSTSADNHALPTQLNHSPLPSLTPGDSASISTPSPYPLTSSQFANTPTTPSRKAKRMHEDEHMSSPKRIRTLKGPISSTSRA